MICTTTLLALQIPLIKHLSPFLGLAFFLFFGFIEGCFWGASLKKVPAGAWFPLTIGCALTIFMLFWTWGRDLEDTFEGSRRKNLNKVVLKEGSKPVDLQLDHLPTLNHQLSHTEDDADHIKKVSNELPTAVIPDDHLWIKDANEAMQKLERIDTLAIFHKTSEGKGTPHAFSVFLRQIPALPKVVVSDDGCGLFEWNDLKSDSPNLSADLLVHTYRRNTLCRSRGPLLVVQSTIPARFLRFDDEIGLPGSDFARDSHHR